MVFEKHSSLEGWHRSGGPPIRQVTLFLWIVSSTVGSLRSFYSLNLNRSTRLKARDFALSYLPNLPFYLGHTDSEILQVYKATFQKVVERNKEYYLKYPEDIDAVHGLAFHIKSKGGLSLPSGGVLTVRGLLTLGRNFGMHGGLDTVHDLILRASTDLKQFQFISRPTLSAIEGALSFDDVVLYAVLHEATYCQAAASNWAAERVGRTLREFQWLSGSPQSASSVREMPLYFSGEMIYPFLFDLFPELEKLSNVAEILAKYSGWPELYDEWQLARNEVPLYAATFVDDMYVDFGLAQETAKLVKNCKQYITNGMYHDAIRSKTDEIMKELFALRDDSID